MPNNLSFMYVLCTYKYIVVNQNAYWCVRVCVRWRVSVLVCISMLVYICDENTAIIDEDAPG